MSTRLAIIAMVMVVQVGCLLAADPPVLTGNGACYEQGCDPTFKCDEYGYCQDYCYGDGDCRTGFDCVDDYESSWHTKCVMYCDEDDLCLEGWSCVRSDLRNDICVKR